MNTITAYKRYLGNKSTKQVHDTKNEQRNCQLSEIAVTHREWFDTLSEAKRNGYDTCAYCLSGS